MQLTPEEEMVKNMHYRNVWLRDKNAVEEIRSNYYIAMYLLLNLSISGKREFSISFFLFLFM